MRKVSIVIPAYNEAGRILGTLNALAQSSEIRQCEIIVVCDGCEDSTESVVREWATSTGIAVSVISYPVNRGKGYAVRKGILSATGDIVGFMDSDGSTDVSALKPTIDMLSAGTADIVIASRRLKDSTVFPEQPWHRKLLGNCFSLTTQHCLNLPIRDTQCGFKFFQREVARQVFEPLRCDGFGFDVEILVRGRRRGCRIHELPVVWRDAVGSTVSPMRDGLRMLATVGRIYFDKPRKVAVNDAD